MRPFVTTLIKVKKVVFFLHGKNKNNVFLRMLPVYYYKARIL